MVVLRLPLAICAISSGLLLLENTVVRQLGKPLLCPTSSLNLRIVGLKIRRCRQRIRKQWSICLLGKESLGRAGGASHSTLSFCDAFIIEVKMLRKPRFDVGEPRGLPAEGVTLEWPLPLRLG